MEFDSADVFGGINMELEEVNNKDLERVNKMTSLLLFICDLILDPEQCP